MSDFIEIIGAETHNLKNVSVKIPKNKLVVVTGVSGSGKSSLAFETLYAEGQKRYLESLSTYARMIISDTSDATKVREIRGLSPTIAINQKTVSNNPRSTVGTITEIYDFYRLLFANIGTPYCVHHPDQSLKKDTIQNIFDDIMRAENGEKIFIIFPFSCLSNFDNKMSIVDIKNTIADKGFVRFLKENEVFSVADDMSNNVEVNVEDVSIIVDRLVKKTDDSHFETRLRDSLLLASEKSGGTIHIFYPEKNFLKKYSLHNSCAICGYSLGELSLSNFSFNSHYGACDDCAGLGQKTSFEEKNIIDENLSLADGAVLPWQSSFYEMLLEKVCEAEKIPFDKPYKNLTAKQKEKILYGVDGRFEAEYTWNKQVSSYKARFEGIIPWLERKYMESEGKRDVTIKSFMKFATEKECRNCSGYRIKKEFLQVRIAGKNIGEVASLSVSESLKFFKNLTLTESEKTIAKDIYKNVVERLEFLE